MGWPTGRFTLQKSLPAGGMERCSQAMGRPPRTESRRMARPRDACARASVCGTPIFVLGMAYFFNTPPGDRV